jgi:hypothetical protein
MKQVSNIFILFIFAATITTSSTGCKKVLGLEKQTDWNFDPVTLDPHINISAWEFLKKRALGTVPADTILKRMYQGIIYAGIDSAEYMKENRTYVFLHNDAIVRGVNTDAYWGFYKVGSPLRVATSWSEYPVDSVRNWLLYLIAEGNHTFETLGPIVKEVNTLMPKNVNPNNPESIITFRINNASDSKFMINDFIGSLRSTTARTAGIIATNGPVHVVDRIVEYRR